MGQVTASIFLMDFLLDSTGGAVMKNLEHKRDVVKRKFKIQVFIYLAIFPFLEAMEPGWEARNRLYFFPFLRSMA